MSTLTFCIKNWWRALYPIVSCLFAYLWLNSEVYSILAILLIFDTITWLLKAKYIWHKPTSNEMRRWVISKMLMMAIPFLLALIAKAATPSTWDVATWISSSMFILCVAELYSIMQNIISIRTWKEIAEYDAVTETLVRLNNWLKSIIDKFIPASPQKWKTKSGWQRT